MHFFIVAFSILTLFYGYIGWRIIIPGGFGFPWNVILWILLAVFLITPFISITLRVYGYSANWVYVLTWIAYLSMGFFSIVFAFLAVRDIFLLCIGILHKFCGIVRGFLHSDVQSADPLNPERHHFLVHTVNMGILGISGIFSGYGLYEARKSPDVVNVTVPVSNLPEDLDGFRFVQITDIHAGSTITRRYVGTVVEKVNGLNPDAILFTGDLVDGTVSNLRDDVAPLAELSARYGSYFVTGNHEYYSGPEAWIEEIERLGLTVLLNEHRTIQHGTGTILLAGVTDYNGGYFIKSHESSPEAALKGAPPHDVKILMAHQPRSVFAAARAEYDLVISGHTHGGQYFPWNFFVCLQQPYTSGLHMHENTWIYVSKGTGYWGPPFRIGVPSEITVITLSKG